MRMKKYDVKPEKPSGGRETLPAGGYVCSILNAKVESNDWGDTLVIAHDVCEGEYAGLFKRDYDNNTMEDKKWRGTFRLKLPKDDGTEQDAWRGSRLHGEIQGNSQKTRLRHYPIRTSSLPARHQLC